MEEGPTYSVALGVELTLVAHDRRRIPLVALDRQRVPLVALDRRRIAPAFSVGFPAIDIFINGLWFALTLYPQHLTHDCFNRDRTLTRRDRLFLVRGGRCLTCQSTRFEESRVSGPALTMVVNTTRTPIVTCIRL